MLVGQTWIVGLSILEDVRKIKKIFVSPRKFIDGFRKYIQITHFESFF
jgi:hypothetical protein